MNSIKKGTMEKWWYIIAGVIGAGAVLGVSKLDIPDKNLVLIVMALALVAIEGWLMFKE